MIDEMTFIMAHTVENRCLKFHGEHHNTSACASPKHPSAFYNSLLDSSAQLAMAACLFI